MNFKISTTLRSPKQPSTNAVVGVGKKHSLLVASQSGATTMEIRVENLETTTTTAAN